MFLSCSLAIWQVVAVIKITYKNTLLILSGRSWNYHSKCTMVLPASINSVAWTQLIHFSLVISWFKCHTFSNNENERTRLATNFFDFLVIFSIKRCKNKAASCRSWKVELPYVVLWTIWMLDVWCWKIKWEYLASTTIHMGIIMMGLGKYGYT